MRKPKLPPFLIAAALVAVLLIVLGTVLASHSGSGGENSGISDREKELAAFLEGGEGIGKASVRLCLSADGATVTGAAVVCEGGNDPVIASKVMRLLAAALGVGVNHIFVVGAA